MSLRRARCGMGLADQEIPYDRQPMPRPLRLAACLSFALAGACAPTLSPALFRHHFVTRDTPSERRSGFAPTLLADFDRDGRLDVAFGAITESLTWYRFEAMGRWTARPVGPMQRSLGGATLDLDGDGWTDIVTGQFWYRNQRDGTFAQHE